MKTNFSDRNWKSFIAKWKVLTALFLMTSMTNKVCLNGNYSTDVIPFEKKNSIYGRAFQHCFVLKILTMHMFIRMLKYMMLF